MQTTVCIFRQYLFESILCSRSQCKFILKTYIGLCCFVALTFYNLSMIDQFVLFRKIAMLALILFLLVVGYNGDSSLFLFLCIVVIVVLLYCWTLCFRCGMWCLLLVKISFVRVLWCCSTRSGEPVIMVINRLGNWLLICSLVENPGRWLAICS